MFRKASSKIICLLAMGALAVSACLPSQAQRLSAAEKTAWAHRLRNILPNSIEGSRTVQELAAMDSGDDIFELVSENWNYLANSDIKQYILTCVAQNDNSRIIDILNLGVTDSSLAVQNRALQFVESFGFNTFTDDFSSYVAWRQKNEGKPLSVVFENSLADVESALLKADETHKSDLLNILLRANFTGSSETSRIRRAAAMKLNLPDALVPMVRQQNNLMWTAFQVLRNLRPDEAFLKRAILPLSDVKIEPAVRYQALSILGFEWNQWAVDPLEKMLLAEYPDPSAEVVAQTLGQIADPHVIPLLISLMESDNTPEGNRVLGNVLAPLTGITNTFIRDAAWWKSWWTKNNIRFPADVRTLPFPKLAVRARPAPAANLNGIAMATPIQHQIGDNLKKTYWLIDPRLGGRAVNHGPIRRLQINPAVLQGLRVADGQLQPPPPPIVGNAKPANGVVAADPDSIGLIVVLTADGDGAGATGFWRDVAIHALDGKYCIAVVNAPKWVDNQPLVWLTAPDLKNIKEAKFDTESLVDDVAKDAISQGKLDTNRVFLHGVGAGGVAAYAASLEAKSPFHSFYVLSATFKSSALPPLDHAAGKRYLIQNTKEDKVHPYWMAEAAVKLLTQKNATVKLDPTAGYLTPETNDATMAAMKSYVDWLANAKS